MREHHKQIDVLYDSIVKCLQTASEEELCVSGSHIRKHKNHNIPGWNDYVKDAHEAAREAFRTWHVNGKPRQGTSFNIMKRTRALFKYALRRCKRNEAQIKADLLAKSVSHKDYRTFWKDIKNAQNENMPQATCINGVSGSDSICDMWAEHYSDNVFGIHELNEKSVCELDEKLRCADINDVMFVTIDEMTKVVKRLSLGKAAGLNRLTA